MDPSPINVEDIFQVAAALKVGERAAYLDAACGDDIALRARIERLLSAGDQSGFMDVQTTPISPAVAAELSRLKPEHSGERIGPYKLLERLGAGGFGSVWIAEQAEPVDVRVALKIIKMGMDTKEVIARFEQERQVLAMMDHPNIAKVFDAGSTRWGRPFFVMELVRGIKITDYCDKANLPTAERLDLFISVCRAVQHAHQKGIIHRDLKPSNILVMLHDGKPVPKIIDFGVAKATQARLTDLTIHTELKQMVGTPLYMSPEQAEMSALDIDTRSDIYSVGVVLYELLTGRTPFDAEELMKQGVDEIRRVIREQEPPRPSTVVKTLSFELRTSIAKQRRTELPKLISLLRGDLDWIVMKAMEKDRTRRYETVNGLAMDVQRFLASEPVLARAPSQFYRFRRLVKRNKIVFAAGAAVAAALLIGSTVGVSQAVRANYESRRANAALAQLRAVLAQLRDTVRDSAPALAAQARELLMKEKFDEAITKLSYAIQLQPESVEYLRERAALLQAQLHLAEAAADFRRVLELRPGDASAQANAVLCERLLAGPREANGTLTRASLTELYVAMAAEQRPAAELRPLALLVGRANELLRDFLKSLPAGSGTPMHERLKADERGLLSLDLRGTNIADLSPLRGMLLDNLDLEGCSELRSINALRGMPLRTLNLAGTGVASLGPLAEMRTLEELTLNGTPATDLSPLRGLPLRTLRLVRTDVSDLSPLSGMPLAHLELGQTRVTDLSPLRGLPLRTLRLVRTDVSDLSPLSGMPLAHLELGQTRVTDLSPLVGMPLKVLECSYTPVASYAPLAKLPLEELALQGVRLGDLDFTRGLPLKVLILAGARDFRHIEVLGEVTTLELLVLPGELTHELIEGIESLKKLPVLKRLSFTLAEGSRAESAEAVEVFWQKWDATMRWWRPLRAAGIKMKATHRSDDTWAVTAQSQPLTSLAMFADSNISELDLSACRGVANLSPLRGLPLKTLGISHTAVTDLAPLRGMKIRSLWMADTAVTDLAPLRGMPLKRLYMDKCSQLSDLAPLLDVPELEELLLPEGAVNVTSLRDALPKLRRISYTYDARSGQPASAVAEFWKEYHELDWLYALRATKAILAAEQLADGTWTLAVNTPTFSDLAVLRGTHISILLLNGTNVSDVHPLAKLPLRRLRLDATPCSDVSPLAHIPTIESIVLPRHAAGIAALRTLPALKRLAFEADGNGDPALEAAAFWKEFDASNQQ